MKIDQSKIRLLIKSCCNCICYNHLLNSVVILQPLGPVDDYKDESNDRFNTPGEVDTPLQSLTLLCGLSGIFQVEFFPSIILFPLIDMHQIIVVSLEVLENQKMNNKKLFLGQRYVGSLCLLDRLMIRMQLQKYTYDEFMGVKA